MTKSKLLIQVEEFAKKCCGQYDLEQDLWRHVQLVRQFALKLSKAEGVDIQVLECAALLHDTGKNNKDGRKRHSIRSYRLSKKFLETVDLPTSKKGLILECVLKHSSRFSANENRIEVRVMQCADALGVLFDDEWQEYTRKTISQKAIKQLYEKSLKKITLESARRLAEPQIVKLKAMLLQ
jgi:HD superfamily phosphodiesterase